MEDFVIMSVKNFSYAQNYQNWKDVESFMFFSLYMYTNNAVNKNIGYYVQFVSLIDLIHSF